jgi:hypothetical protein
MWKVEFRPMTSEERLELERVRGEIDRSWKGIARSWMGRLFGAAHRSAAALTEALRRDLNNGKVQVIHVTAGEAVRLIHSDGSLAGFFVDIGTGLVMFVEPRDWDAPGMAADFEGLFPCTSFCLIRAPHSGVDLDFLCEGRRFGSTRELEAPSRDILGTVVQDGEFLPARLASLEEDLERWLRQSSPGMTPRVAI